ncbi:MAG: hypothetical protein NUV70_07470 [Caldiserica bacterium]|jgi:hypothetical protein|nr:hypothetical protein [Caldisericota bacterium]
MGRNKSLVRRVLVGIFLGVLVLSLVPAAQASLGPSINSLEPQPPSPKLLEKIVYEGMNKPAGEEMAPLGFLEPFPNPKTYPTATPTPITMKEVEIANLEGVTLPVPLRILFVWGLDTNYSIVGLKIPVRFYLENTGSATIFGQFELKPFDLEYGLEGQAGRSWKEKQVSRKVSMQPLVIPPGAIIGDTIEIQFDTPGSYWLVPLTVFQIKVGENTFLPYSLRGEVLPLFVLDVK